MPTIYDTAVGVGTVAELVATGHALTFQVGDLWYHPSDDGGGSLPQPILPMRAVEWDDVSHGFRFIDEDGVPTPWYDQRGWEWFMPSQTVSYRDALSGGESTADTGGGVTDEEKMHLRFIGDQVRAALDEASEMMNELMRMMDGLRLTMTTVPLDEWHAMQDGTLE